MPLTLVEPGYDGKQVDHHVFTCAGCGRTEIYSFDWAGPIGAPMR